MKLKWSTNTSDVKFHLLVVPQTGYKDTKLIQLMKNNLKQLLP